MRAAEAHDRGVTMVEHVESLVIGAGVVGLAVARRLAMAGREVVVLEAADGIGEETSSRNSEVIHAGIYYQPGSLKAKLCVAGKHALYRFCADHGIAHRRLGKLIVACGDDEVPRLAALKGTAEANGVNDLAWLDPAEVRRLEPEVRCVAALHSPSTGIIDSHALMLALQGAAEDRGAMIAFRTPMLRGEVQGDRFIVEAGGAMPMHLSCVTLVNAAGLSAQRVAASLAGLPAATIPTAYIAKGSYFVLSGRCPFRRLVYPMPPAGGLGVHVTLDLAGQAKFGPDVEWVDAIDYDVDPARAESFYAAIRTYWPDLPDGALLPGYAGIRPKLVGPGAPPADFMIQGLDDHGVSGLVNLYGIESPGLTAALAIADRVAAVLGLGADGQAASLATA